MRNQNYSSPKTFLFSIHANEISGASYYFYRQFATYENNVQSNLTDSRRCHSKILPVLPGRGRRTWFIQREGISQLTATGQIPLSLPSWQDATCLCRRQSSINTQNCWGGCQVAEDTGLGTLPAPLVTRGHDQWIHPVTKKDGRSLKQTILLSWEWDPHAMTMIWAHYHLIWDTSQFLCTLEFASKRI